MRSKKSSYGGYNSNAYSDARGSQETLSYKNTMDNQTPVPNVEMTRAPPSFDGGMNTTLTGNGKMSFSVDLDQTDKLARFKRRSFERFYTKRRAPFKYPCDRCLNYGYTRTYKEEHCYFMQIFSTVCAWIGILIYGAVANTLLSWVIVIVTFGAPFFFIYRQLEEKICKVDTVIHMCSNCGEHVANYRDPGDVNCFERFLPDGWCRKITYAEDDFKDESMVFHQEQVWKSDK